MPYLLRRLLPAPGTLATRSLYQVQLGDRIDTIANSQLGDPTLSWQLGDANLAHTADPARPPGHTLVIPCPQASQEPARWPVS